MKHPDPSNVKRILIVKLYGIGNALLSIPFLKEVRTLFPNAKITILIERRSLAVFNGLDVWDELLFLPEKFILGKFKLLFKMIKSRPDIIFSSFLMNNKTCEKCFRLSGAKYIYGHPTDGNSTYYTTSLCYDRNKHEVLLNMDLLKPFMNFDKNKIKIDFPIPQEQKKLANKIIKTLSEQKTVKIGMHIGCNWDMPQKRYPEKKFAILADKLIQKLNAEIILFGGSDEKALGEAVSLLMEEKPVNFIDKYNLTIVAALIQKCDLFISNDSGLMHLAASVGCPLISLFGPTSTKKNAPWGDPAIIKIIKSKKSCSPCHIPGNMIDCSAGECMELIQVNDIFHMAKKMLNSKINQF